jgi:hypothetical protein
LGFSKSCRMMLMAGYIESMNTFRKERAVIGLA